MFLWACVRPKEIEAGRRQGNHVVALFPEKLACHAKIGPAGPILAENFAKICPPRTTFAAKTGPPCQFWSPCTNINLEQSIVIAS